MPRLRRVEGRLRLGAVRRRPAIRVPAGPDMQVDDANFLRRQPPDAAIRRLPDRLRGDARRDDAPGAARSPWPWRMLGLADRLHRQLPLRRAARRPAPGWTGPSAWRAASARSATNDVVRPIKILFAIDASQSMRGERPERHAGLRDGRSCSTRCPAIRRSTSRVMLFAGSTTALLTQSGLAEFDQLAISYSRQRTARTLDRPAPQLHRTRTPTATRPTSSSRSPRSTRSISTRHRRQPSTPRRGAPAEPRARYSVIFLSDGHPTFNQDDELLPRRRGRGAFASSRILVGRRAAQHGARLRPDVQPIAPRVCDLTGDAGCPLLIINQDAERLERMASAGRRRLPRLPEPRAGQLPRLQARRRPGAVRHQGRSWPPTSSAPARLATGRRPTATATA